MSKVDYDLYQVKRGEEHSDLLFTNMSMIQKLKFKIDQSHYDKVYSGSTDKKEYVGEVLESLFVKFNLEFPADYRARSMSVSDVVVLHENGVDKAYFCDSIGFIEVPQFLQADAMVTMDTTGLAVDGHFGTWHTIDTQKIGGRIDTQSKLTPGDDTESHPEQISDNRTSVLERLKEKQSEVPAKSKTGISPTRSSNDILLD